MFSTVPDVIFKTRVRDESIGGDNPFRWQDVSTDDVFKGKKIVILALPGAYTPTCSTKHLPGYDAKYQELIDQGVDEVYCLSVNDAFVMYQWSKHLNVTHVKMLPDGNGDFTTICNRDEKLLQGFDEDIRDFLVDEMTGKGISILFNTDVEAIEHAAGDDFAVRLTDGGKMTTDLVMYATGRTPNSSGLGLEKLGVALDDKGAIKVNSLSNQHTVNLCAGRCHRSSQPDASCHSGSRGAGELLV